MQLAALPVGGSLLGCCSGTCGRLTRGSDSDDLLQELTGYL